MTENTETTPRWVKVFALIAVVLAVLAAVVLLTGRSGSHGPGRHVGDSGSVRTGSHTGPPGGVTHARP